jgi:hypothetical protein
LKFTQTVKGLASASWIMFRDWVTRRFMGVVRWFRDLACATGRSLVEDFRVPAVLFALGMLGYCGLLGWQAVDLHAIRTGNDQIVGDIAYNRGRVNLQQKEYDEAAALLPELRERVALLPAQAEAAKAARDELKTARKEAAAGYDNIRDATEAAQQRARDAEARLEEARAAYEDIAGTRGEEGQP